MGGTGLRSIELMRRVPAAFQDGLTPRVHRVVALEHVAQAWEPDVRLLVPVRDATEAGDVARWQAGGLNNVAWVKSSDLQENDVVLPLPSVGKAAVLYRESDVHHGLLLTNRCNSHCLMCSQPPTPQRDDWLVQEALDVLRHIRRSPSVLGLSGGEPLLLGSGLRRVLDAARERHPAMQIDLLTNGRLLADGKLAEETLKGLSQTSWLVPLYGPADFQHDFVVQVPGAFDQTVAGLLALQAHGQPVQLRIVLIEPVLQQLEELCLFVGRNLPFVREVALMACEPIGFALANRSHCEVDLAAWSETLLRAAKVLRRHGLRFLFMNTPLCALPPSLWAEAHQSISDWKNVYASECGSCKARQRCAGLFAWHEAGWKPTTIRPIAELCA